ncbi:tetratricopeptide repeat protein [Erythrobacter insulae]|uniref:Tetratricopeptide repeat protein n=2 Tax=Erythrobacter insulae TaxID=2584124 RepID=A0A547PES2_9SPHN|nr:tetratricopeptide repeat protein [Erythrobacter insulae]
MHISNMLRAAAPIAIGLSALAGAPLAAQESTSREVVQALPSKDVQRLNRALLRLAKQPDNVSALIEAGEASSNAGDLDAAIGFYGRANDLAPNDARIKLGMANIYLRSGRPTEALPLFAAAQSAGADASDLLSDRALAFDMLGDTASAQAAHLRAISLQPKDTEAKRRLAISYAIAGNRAGFEEILRPLLDRRDFASFRARAFGLAIMGEQDRASAIVDAVMPRDLAGRINPYLAYMPRLTKSQQAAAANLGIFPKAADIGREDPRIAAYSSGVANNDAMIARSAGSKLEPAGEPLGTPTASLASSADAVSTPVSTPVSAPAERKAAQSMNTPVAAPGFDLAKADTSAAAKPVVAPAPKPVVQKVVRKANVADAFADLGGVVLPDTEASGDAVDLAIIEIPREAAPEPKVQEPEKPDHPSRIWVQLATGRDVSALKFDWRRLSRKSAGLLDDFDPHVTPWGQANRLLAGPVKSLKEASDLINALKDKGIDTFRFTSPEGTEIKSIK